MERILQPEILDTLDPQHPDAIHNRRDLRLTNLVMGNHRWFARTLPKLTRPGEHALELGAGTGELGRRLAQSGLAADGLDLWPRPEDWPAKQAWHTADLRKFDRYAGYQVVFGNLIFHQFSDAELAALGRTLQQNARMIVACEPLRRRLSQRLYAVISPLLGANHVTRHDARVSIAAGFVGDELPRLLELDPAEWKWSVVTTALGAYRMIAVRRP